MTSVLTQMVSRGLLAPSLVVAAAILVKSYADVGDGFAAGVVAALAVLLQYLAFGRREVAAALPVHRAGTVAMAGLGISFLVFAVPFLAGGAPLEHWPPPGSPVLHVGTLEIITAVAFDVGVAALVFGALVGIIGYLAHARGEEESS